MLKRQHQLLIGLNALPYGTLLGQVWYYFHTDNAIAWPILHILQAGAGILYKCRVYVNQSEEEHQSLQQQQKLNCHLNLAAIEEREGKREIDFLYLCSIRN